MIKISKMTVKSRQNTEAKSEKIDRNKDLILGVKITGTTYVRVLNLIRLKCMNNVFLKPLFIVTAYSEFFLKAIKDREFAEILNRADLVLPDGVSVLAASDYLKLRKKDDWEDFFMGLRIGLRILAGEYADNKIEGVRLTRDILKEAGINGWRVFLLGGKDGVAGRLGSMMKRDYKNMEIGWEEGYTNIKSQFSLLHRGYEGQANSQINNNILNKINNFRPDILLVAYGMPWQEKWIAGSLDKLQAKVVMGVGSSFDEIMKEGPWRKQVPDWVNIMGLKWLWRVTANPKHWRRAWNAFPVFTWKVYRSK